MFPLALMVDPRFNYSSNFERMIATPRSGFIKVPWGGLRAGGAWERRVAST
jgi:hypothetical protein